METIQEFINRKEEQSQTGVLHKNNQIKRNIVAYLAINDGSTLAELSRHLHISIPTITKLVNELVAEGIITDNGKIETSGGRRPNFFDLAHSSLYFVGVEIARDEMRFVLTDMKNNVVATDFDADFVLVDTPECFEQICRDIEKFIEHSNVDRNKILGIGVGIAGRVNPNTGRSYKYFTEGEQPIRQTLEERFGIRTLIENDSRARCFAEYTAGQSVQDEKNVLFFYSGRGVAIGIVIDGKLYYGKSGFAGEFGHTPFFDNEIICSCGKKGCLETEISGVAIEKKMVDRMKRGVSTILQKQYDSKGAIRINDIIAAAKNDDMLSIELIEEAGEKIGKSVAFLINIFNPELVIIGGNLAQAGDFLMLPLKAAVSKYSLGLVSNDTSFRLTKMGDNAGALGAAMLIRNKVIGL